MTRMIMRSCALLALAGGSLAVPTAVGVASAAPAPGSVAVVVGGGVRDGGQATDATLRAEGAVYAPDGTLYLADIAHNRVRRVATDGTISTVAGTSGLTNGHGGFSGDGGPAVDADLYQPTRLALTPQGDLVVVDSRNHRVRQVDHATGVITTIAGNGSTGAGVPAVDATTQPMDPADVVVDPATGDVLIADPTAKVVWARHGDGSLSVLVGGGTTWPDTGEAPTAARLLGPSSLALMPDGALLIGESNAGTVRRVSGGAVDTVVGTQQGAAAAGQPAATSYLPGLRRLVVATDGTVYAASSSAWTFTVGGVLATVPSAPCPDVAALSPGGRPLVLCAGAYLQQPDSTFAQVAGTSPPGQTVDVTLDGDDPIDAAPSGSLETIRGELYLTGTSRAGTATIDRVGLDGLVHRVAGSDVVGATTPEGASALTGPVAAFQLAAAPNGGLLANSYPRLRLIKADGTVESVTGTAPAPFTEGEPAAALGYQSDMATDADGDVYVVEGGDILRVIRWSDLTVHTVVPSLTALGSTSNLQQQVVDLAVAPDGDVLVLSSEGYGYPYFQPDRSRVRRIDPVTGDVAQVSTGPLLKALSLGADGTVFVTRAATSATAGVTAAPGTIQVLGGDGSLTTVAGNGNRVEATVTDPESFDASGCGALSAQADGSVLAACSQRVVRVTPPSPLVVAAPVTGLTWAPAPASGPTFFTVSWQPPAAAPDGAVLGLGTQPGVGAPAPVLVGSTLSIGTTSLLHSQDAGKPYRYSLAVLLPDGSRSAPASITVVAPGDVTPPAAPDFNAGWSSGTTADLAWLKPNNADLAAIEVRITPGSSAPTSAVAPSYTGLGTQTTLTGLVAGQTYTVLVSARDYAGNAASAPAATFVAGEKPPVNAAGLPANGAWLPGTVPVVTAVSGLPAFPWCRLDGQLIGCGPGPTFFLTQGQHTLEVWRSNQFGESDHVTRTFNVDTSLPTAKVVTPSPFTLASSWQVSFGGTDTGSGIAYYRLRWWSIGYDGRVAATQYPTAWQHLTTTKVSLALAPGRSYCVQAQSVDKVGHSSAWSAFTCTARPIDDRTMVASAGWTRATLSSAYLGTYSTTKTLKAQLTRTGTASSRVALVATRCSGCGTVGIYSGSTLLKSVSLSNATTQRQWLYVLPKMSFRSATLSVRVLSSGKPVQVDGLGISYYG